MSSSFPLSSERERTDVRVPNIEILSGEPGASSVSAEAVSVDIRRELNRIPEATVRLATKQVGERRKLNFEVGQSVIVRLSDEDRKLVLFKGLVVRWMQEFASAEGAGTRLELKDPAFRLTRQRKSAVFRKQTDSDAIRALVEEAKLKVGTLDFEKELKHDEMVQFWASDWDFIVCRADAQARVVDVHDAQLSVRKMLPGGASKPKARLQIPTTDGGAKRDTELVVGGTNESIPLQSLELELDGGEPWAELGARSWDTKRLQTTPLEVVKSPKGFTQLAEKLGGASGELSHLAQLSLPERKAWASSRVARSQRASVQGRLAFSGRLDFEPSQVLGLDGLDPRFGRELFISAVDHRVDQNGWRTELQLGMSPVPFARQPDITDMPAGGLLPAVQGLHLGVVKAFEKDPLGDHRVKVQLSAFEAKQGPVWARVARPDAGEGRGWLFWPEAGDEVIVGFVNGDPRQAIVLGSLHSSHVPPPPNVGPPNKNNDQRGLVSRSGTVVAFDDKRASVTIETAKKNRIVVDDTAESIEMADQHGNTITLNAQGITLNAKNLHLEGTEKVVIRGAQVDVK